MASVNGQINGQANAKDFVKNVYSKYLKVSKVCDTASECGFPPQIQPSNPSADKLTSDNLLWSNISANPVHQSKYSIAPIYVETADGYSAKIFYKPNCRQKNKSAYNGFYDSYNKCPNVGGTSGFYNICLNIIYDMNGTKSPNHVGEDIGIVSVFWSGIGAESVAPGIIPYKYNETLPYNTVSSGQKHCATNVPKKYSATLPTENELFTLFINSSLSSIKRNADAWSGTSVNGSKCYWDIYSYPSSENRISTYSRDIFCVRR